MRVYGQPPRRFRSIAIRKNEALGEADRALGFGQGEQAGNKNINFRKNRRRSIV